MHTGAVSIDTKVEAEHTHSLLRYWNTKSITERGNEVVLLFFVFCHNLLMGMILYALSSAMHSASGARTSVRV
jgi:hypothetical protein